MQARTNRHAQRMQWEERIRQQQTSGLSVKTFCKQEHLSLATFYWWKRKLAEGDAEKGVSGFVELMSKENEEAKGKRITLYCEGKYRIEIEEGTSAVYVAKLVRALMEVR